MGRVSHLSQKRIIQSLNNTLSSCVTIFICYLYKLSKPFIYSVPMNPSGNNTNYRHIIYPALMLLLFFAVALSPVNLLGCRTRGLLALVIALVCGLSSVFAAIKALKGRLKGDADSQWWMITTIILTIPVVAMIIMA